MRRDLNKDQFKVTCKLGRMWSHPTSGQPILSALECCWVACFYPSSLTYHLLCYSCWRTSYTNDDSSVLYWPECISGDTDSVEKGGDVVGSRFGHLPYKGLELLIIFHSSFYQFICLILSSFIWFFYIYPFMVIMWFVFMWSSSLF